MRELIDTPAVCRAFAGHLDTMHDLPRVGVHVGQEPHCAMPATWDGTGAVPVGWTSHWGGASATGVLVVDTPVVPDGDQRLTKLTGLERAAYVIARNALRQIEEPAPELLGALKGSV